MRPATWPTGSKCEYMLDHVGDEFDGVIASVTGFGFFVRLADIHIDGLVHVSTLTNDYYQFDPAHAADRRELPPSLPSGATRCASKA